MNRVAPRDIFNEANFLKNLAYIVDAVENQELENVVFNGIDLDNSDKIFLKDPHSGSWSLSPYQLDRPVFSRADNNDVLILSRDINDRKSNSVYFEDDKKDDFDIELYSTILDENDNVRDDVCKYIGVGPSTCNSDQSSELFSRAVFIKCIAKFALDSIPNVAKEIKGLFFNEDEYQENGLIISESIENHYYYELKNEGLLERAGKELFFRCPSVIEKDNLWPMEACDDGIGEDYVDVYNPDGTFTDVFLDMSKSISYDFEEEERLDMEEDTPEFRIKNN